MNASENSHPYLVITAVLNSSSRAAALTQSHGEAMERAMNASVGTQIAGMDLIELPVTPAVFDALKKRLSLSNETIGLYDVFPIAGHVDGSVRRVAGQFLASEVLWTLEEQGLLSGVPLNIRLDLPKGWDADPKKIHEKLVSAGALELSAQGVETFKTIKTKWDESVRA